MQYGLGALLPEPPALDVVRHLFTVRVDSKKYRNNRKFVANFSLHDTESGLTGPPGEDVLFEEREGGGEGEGRGEKEGGGGEEGPNEDEYGGSFIDDEAEESSGTETDSEESYREPPKKKKKKRPIVISSGSEDEGAPVEGEPAMSGALPSGSGAQGGVVVAETPNNALPTTPLLVPDSGVANLPGSTTSQGLVEKTRQTRERLIAAGRALTGTPSTAFRGLVLGDSSVEREHERRGYLYRLQGESPLVPAEARFRGRLAEEDRDRLEEYLDNVANNLAEQGAIAGLDDSEHHHKRTAFDVNNSPSRVAPRSPRDRGQRPGSA